MIDNPQPPTTPNWKAPATPKLTKMQCSAAVNLPPQTFKSPSSALHPHKYFSPKTPHTTNWLEVWYHTPTIVTGIPEEDDQTRGLTLWAVINPNNAVDPLETCKNKWEEVKEGNIQDANKTNHNNLSSTNAGSESSPNMDTSDADSKSSNLSTSDATKARAGKVAALTCMQTNLFDLIRRIMEAEGQDGSQLELQRWLVRLMDDTDPSNPTFMHPIIQGEASRERVAICTAKGTEKMAGTVINLEDTTNKSSKEGWTLVTQPKPKEPKVTTKTLRLDITIDIAAVMDNKGAEKLVLKQLSKLLKGIIKTDPKAALLPWSKVDKELDAITCSKFPSTFANLGTASTQRKKGACSGAAFSYAMKTKPMIFSTVSAKPRHLTIRSFGQLCNVRSHANVGGCCIASVVWTRWSWDVPSWQWSSWK